MKSIMASLGLLLLCSAAPMFAYQLVDQEVSFPDYQFLRHSQTYQIGDNPLDRFSVTRALSLSFDPRRPPILIFSPIEVSGEYAEISLDSKYRNSLVGKLAREGFDVWVTADRINSMPAGQCEEPGIDCSVMRDWGIDTRLADANFVLQQIRFFYGPRVKPIVLGLAGGSPGAIALVNQRPKKFSALFAWQGTTFTSREDIQAFNQPLCSFYNDLLDQGVIYSDSFASLKLIGELARAHPDGPAPPLPGIPEGLTNHQLLVLIMTTQIASPLAFSPDYVFAAGDFVTDQLFHISEELFFKHFDLFNDYFAYVKLRDMTCSLAGEISFTDNLDRFTGKVFFMGGTLAFGPMMEDTAELFENAESVEVDIIEGFGEADRYENEDRAELMDRPLINWLKTIWRY